MKCQSLADYAEHYAHSALMSNVGQGFLDFFIAAAEQWLTCLERATSNTGGGGTVGLAEMEFDTQGKFAAYQVIVSIFRGRWSKARDQA